jgi:hypothetical protein
MDMRGPGREYSSEENPVVVASLPSFLEAAEQHPRRVVVLRADDPPTTAELRRYCLALGGIREFERMGEVRAVRYEPSIADSTAMSLDALPLHTDGSFLAQPPERFLLSFSTKDPGGGGVSTFMPVSRILAAAPDWVLEALLTADYLFPRSYDGDLTVSHVGPVLHRDRSAMRIRWRSDDIWRPKVINPHGTEAERAVDWLHDFLCTEEPSTYAADSGETLLVPNTAILHGRTSLTPESSREVLRAWVA